MAIPTSQKLFVALAVICICSIIGIVRISRQGIGNADGGDTIREGEKASLLAPHKQTSLVSRTKSLLPQPQYNDSRHCTSPEFNVSFPLRAGGSGRKTATASSSVTSVLQCGTRTISPLSHFVRLVANQFQHKYSRECREAVRFGVAFGRTYTKKLMPRQQLPHKCAFTFVLEDEVPSPPSRLIQSFGWENLVPVPRSVLPYQNMRRNVKLFKLHGHELFPFARVLIWQDTKLKTRVYPVPIQFFKKFLRTAPGSGASSSACLTVIGLPRSVHSLGAAAVVALQNDDGKTTTYRHRLFQHHCDTIVNTIEERPDVTDSVDAVFYQCQQYQQLATQNNNSNNASLSLHTSTTNDGDTVVSLDRGLIDSAFIVWNQRTSTCRDFNARLACTWSDEIQCHSDRDQISFPHVLRVLGLREINATTTTKESNNVSHSLYMMNSDNNNELMVQIIQKNDCHWYNNKKFPLFCLDESSNSTPSNVTVNNITSTK